MEAGVGPIVDWRWARIERRRELGFERGLDLGLRGLLGGGSSRRRER